MFKLMPPATIFVISNLLDIQTDHYHPIAIPKNNEQNKTITIAATLKLYRELNILQIFSLAFLITAVFLIV